MKKQILAVTLLALAVGITACSSKPQETAATTTAAPETTVAEIASIAETAQDETDDEEEAEEIDEDSMSGTITAVDGDILTILSDGDESEKNYDVSNAAVTKQFDFAEGDQVYLTFPSETTEDPVPVIELEVEISVIGESMDPFVEGVIKDSTPTTITLEVDGEEYTMSSANAYVASKNGIKADVTATVTYVGDLDDSPIAVKIVTEDAYNTPEAEVNAFIGKVAQADEDNIVLESESGDFYTFYSDDIDFSQYSSGQTLQISYSGRISDKDITAEEVTVK